MTELTIAPAFTIPAPRRIYVEFHGFPALRIQPHRTDPSLVVVKSKHPEAFAMLLAAAGAQQPEGGLKTTKGHKYFITFADRAYLGLVLPLVAQSLALPPPRTEIEEYDDDSDELDVHDPDPYSDDDDAGYN